MKRLGYSFIIVIFLITSQIITNAASLYDWGNVAQGGGGFVCSIVFHPLEKDLMYLRTDVGGAYRWNKNAGQWIPLNDAFTASEWNLFGIDGIAVDPQNVNVVYIAAGKYSWDMCDVLKSVDKGETWKRTKLNDALGACGFASKAGFDANGTSRGSGERIAVDPLNSNIIYAGTKLGGLWKSRDGAESWERVELPGFDPQADSKKQPRSIVFDSGTAVNGGSKTIYVGVTGVGTYRSTDGGATWALMAGSPVTTNRMQVGNSGTLYVASSTGLYRFVNQQWNEISPSSVQGGSFFGVAVEPGNENNIYAVYNNPSNIMKLPIYRSNNGGASWGNAISITNITKTVPWLEPDNFSSNTHCIAIDPFDKKHLWFTDWFGVWKTDDIWGLITQWTNPVKGIEEMVAFTAASPPTGEYTLYTGVADNFGMPHTDVTKYPDRKHADRYSKLWMMSATGIDFCEENPNIVVAVGVDHDSEGMGGYSLDGTKTWNKFKSMPLIDDQPPKYGRVAVSSKINPATGYPVIVIVPVNAMPYVSSDMGNTWTKVNVTLIDSTKDDPLVPAIDDYWSINHPIASDRVNGKRFYLVLDRKVYVSEDWGYHWAGTSQSVLKGYDNKGTIIKAAPGMEGEVWVTTKGYGFFRSTDGGKTFVEQKDMTTRYKDLRFGFGKAAPGRKNPAVYMQGTISGVEGIYRSIDMGATWERINDAGSIIGNEIRCVDGDRQTFGTVYIGTGGRGYYYGRLKIPASANAQFSEGFNNGMVSGWTFSNMNVQNNALMNIGTSGVSTAIYDRVKFGGNYKYSVRMKNTGTNASCKTSIIFNYKDTNNYYYVEFSNNTAGIRKIMDGVTETISEGSYSGGDIKVNIFYEYGGYISLDIEENGAVTRLFNRIRDSTFMSGRIGVYADSNTVSFDDISVDNALISTFHTQFMQGLNTIDSISAIQGQAAAIHLSLRSNSLEDMDSQIICTIKDNRGILRSTGIIYKVISTNTTEVSIPINIPSDATDSFKINVYYWDKNTMAPFTQKVSFNN